MLKILCDVDGTVLDLVTPWVSRLGYDKKEVTEYNVAKALGISVAELMEALVQINYAQVQPERDAADFLQELVRRYDFKFVSHSPTEYNTIAGCYGSREACHAAKMVRVFSLLPIEFYATEMATAEERLKMEADVLIDDQLKTVLAWAKRYPEREAILIDQPWNQIPILPNNVFRTMDWQQVAQRLHGIDFHRTGLPVYQQLAEEAIATFTGERFVGPPDLYPSDAKARKAIPLYSGFISYFPDAVEYCAEVPDFAGDHNVPFKTLLAHYSKDKKPEHLRLAWQHLVNLHPEGADGLERDVAKVSWLGNEQHNPGEPLHWARGKSMDQLDAAMRHEVEYRHGKVVEAKGFPILGQAGWRILAELQLCLEAKVS